jgi:hypothetical protein
LFWKRKEIMETETEAEVLFFGGSKDGTTIKIFEPRNGKTIYAPIPDTYMDVPTTGVPPNPVGRYREEIYSLYLISTGDPNPLWIAYDVRKYRSISDLVCKILRIQHKMREMTNE